MNSLNEQRAQHLFNQFKCITCNGESIKESQSNFAVMLRKEIVEYLEEGFDDNQISEHIVKIYGEDIMITSKSSYSGDFIWILPMIIIAFGMHKILRLIKSRKYKLVRK